MAKKSDKKSVAIPAISVITAMYNAEKYVAQCLESLLAQSFQDFEVIVVDDFSTDNSCAIVENFIPKFDGKLKLIRLKKNSGYPGLPRNTAMNVAKGKYIIFLDSDDYFSKTALEEFYNAAEETDADIIHGEKYFEYLEAEDKTVIKTFQKPPFVEKPTLDTEDIGQRLINFVTYKTLWWACNKLFRRDFLVKNKIQFPHITAWEDLVFAFTCVVRAKNYVRVPNVIYNYRIRQGSLSHKGRDAFEMMTNLIGSMKAMDKVMEDNEFLAKHPEYRYMFIDWYVQGRLRTINQGIYDMDKFKLFQIYNIFRKKFFSTNTADQVALYSYFFTQTTFNKRLLESKNKEIAELKKQIADLQAKSGDAVIVVPDNA